MKLSAFNLKKFVPSLGYSVPVECVFQGGKVFAAGGPYTDLYTGTSRDAKRDPRLKESGSLKAFEFEGVRYPLQPTTAFYDWLYINALMENPELAEELKQYDAFTDIEFNPDKSLNCQTRAAAIYVGLTRQVLLERPAPWEVLVQAVALPAAACPAAGIFVSKGGCKHKLDFIISLCYKLYIKIYPKAMIMRPKEVTE